MNNGIEMGDVILFIDGEKYGSLNTFEAKVEINNEEMDSKNFKFSNREYSGTLENVQIEAGFMGSLTEGSQKYTLIAEEYNLPRGNKLPKKKRIRNKWLKKYYKKHIFENVEFTK